MYKLLIVDDEKKIRDGLKKIIRWEDYGVCICGEASDGEEALTFIEAEHPQIVITDIQMPNMDGLALMSRLKELGIDCKVIVLSGYNDYELVRQAMRRGAIDYLLKPSSGEDIVKIIDEIRENMEEEVNSRLKNTEGLRLLKTNVLNRLIRNEISPMELRSKIEILEMTLPKGACRISLITLADEQQEEKRRVRKTMMAYELCEDRLESSDLGESQVFVNTLGQICMLIDDNGAESWTKMKGADCLKALRRELKEAVQTNVVISIGSQAKTYRSVARSYETAQATLEYQFVFEEADILVYDEIRQYFQDDRKIPEIDEKEFESILLQYDYGKIQVYIEKLFAPYLAQRGHENCYVLRNMAMEILFLSCQCYKKESIADKALVAELKDHALREISVLRDVDSIKELMLSFISTLTDHMVRGEKEKYSKLVFDMIQNVKNDYQNQELSLQYLADQYHRNVAYIGRIFKKETGYGFNDYLNAVRIDRAKELLTETQFKGDELCKKVGYANYNYFYIVFKKLTGMNPMDYRNNSKNE